VKIAVELPPIDSADRSGRFRRRQPKLRSNGGVPQAWHFYVWTVRLKHKVWGRVNLQKKPEGDTLLFSRAMSAIGCFLKQMIHMVSKSKDDFHGDQPNILGLTLKDFSPYNQGNHQNTPIVGPIGTFFVSTANHP